MGGGFVNRGCFKPSEFSRRDGRSSSNRWSRRTTEAGRCLTELEGVPTTATGMVLRKRVVVVVADDQSATDTHAAMWALTHVANRGDLLTLIQILPPRRRRMKPLFSDASPPLARSLASICKTRRPEVDVEALVMHGQRLSTVLSQVKKLEASVLVLGQSKPSPLDCFIRSGRDEFVEQCINNADCLAMAVRKPSGGIGGYFITTKWQKNFYLLA